MENGAKVLSCVPRVVLDSTYSGRLVLRCCHVLQGSYLTHIQMETGAKVLSYVAGVVLDSHTDGDRC